MGSILLGWEWPSAARELADTVYRVFRTHRAWPAYSWVEHWGAQRGHEALKILESFPVLGNPYPGSPSYSHIAYDRMHGPSRNNSRVALTIAGLDAIEAKEADLALEVLKQALALYESTEMDPITPKLPSISSSDILLARPDLEDNDVFLIHDVLSLEGVSWLGSGHSNADERSWRYEISPSLLRLRGIHDVADYVACVESLIPVSTDPAHLEPSPLTLPEVLNYLDVTWKLHCREALFPLATPAQGARLASPVVDEVQFRDSCGILADILNSMNLPHVVKSNDRRRKIALLAEYVDARVSEPNSGRASTVLEIDNFLDVRVGQQHSNSDTKEILGLKRIGVAGPPYHWAVAWSTVERVVAASLLRLRSGVELLPRLGCSGCP